MRIKLISLIVIIALSLGAIYLHTISIDVSYHKIHLGNSRRKIRIAHLTDLHTQGIGHIEQRMLEVLEKEKPDLIVITGDLATPGGTFQGYHAVLSKLQAKLGVYFVSGNWEYWEPIPDFEKLLTEAKIENLTNKVKEIDKGLWLVGFDDALEGQPDLSILDDIPQGDIKISLFHSPVYFQETKSRTHLSLAGHSHGGQLLIPFIGSFWLPEGTGKYEQGWFKENQSSLYVSRGIGTSILPVRFNCSPELAIIEVHY
jgi:predicted MPP superfamily phosphohydrolase